MIHPKINFTPPIFPRQTWPKGKLHPHMACQALYYYAILARRNYEDMVEEIKYEDDPFPVPVPARQLFTSLANLYGVEPEQMVKFWYHVDRQFENEDLPKLPEQYRFDKPVEIKTIQEERLN